MDEMTKNALWYRKELGIAEDRIKALDKEVEKLKQVNEHNRDSADGWFKRNKEAESKLKVAVGALKWISRYSCLNQMEKNAKGCNCETCSAKEALSKIEGKECGE